jgi:hypothetical protein
VHLGGDESGATNDAPQEGGGKRNWLRAGQYLGAVIGSPGDSLVAAGAIRVFQEYASGATQARTRCKESLDYLQPGNVLTASDLTRLGCSTAGDGSSGIYRPPEEYVTVSVPKGAGGVGIYHADSHVAVFNGDHFQPLGT